MRLTRLNQLIDEDGKVVEGTWNLTDRHRLEYRRHGKEQQIVLAGDLVAAEATQLNFRVSEDERDGDSIGRDLALWGRWQADPQNRLSFVVERQRGRHNWLTLQGAWEMGLRNEILYRFSQTDLKTKDRSEHLLRFQGYWDVSEDKRLTYVLERNSDSEFRFRGTFQAPSILAKTGEVRYQLGVEVEGKKQVQVITLFGKWKLSRDLSLEFEIPYGDGSTRALVFGATYALDSQSSLSAQLMTRGGEPLGAELVFTREFLKGSGEAFLRLRKSVEEAAVEGGLRFRW